MLEIIITSSLLILIILALRLLLRGKLSPIIIYAMWAIVAVRLLIPVSIAETSISVMNLFEQRENIQQDYTNHSVYSNTVDSTPQSDENNLPEHTAEQPNTPVPDASDAEGQRASISVSDILLAIWLTGAAAVLAYTIISNVRFYLYLLKRRTLACNADCRLPLYIVDSIDSPCMFGIIRPAIYLNDFAAEDTQRTKYIIAHELTHYRHLDHIWAVVRVLCLSMHWFNPLVWLAAHLSKQDCELACDSSAIRTLGDEHRYDYGRTLIDMINTKFQLSTAMMTSTAMTSDAKSIRRRIQMLRITPKNMLWAIIAAAVVLIVAVGCTFTGASKDKSIIQSISSSDTEENAQTEGFDDILAEYFTRFDTENIEYISNIRTVADIISGTVLLPGESFSFNEIVGERTPEKGFVQAEVKANEASVEEYGGGVAQVATTLFNSAFIANLDITEHHTHLYTVDYSENFTYGNDASVVWGVHDLCFTNNTDYPIMIDFYVGESYLTAYILGTDDGTGTRAQMGFVETATENYKVVFRPKQAGKTNVPGQLGRTIRVYRIITSNGVEIDRYRDYEVTYMPQNEVIYTNDLPEGCEYYTEYSPDEIENHDVYIELDNKVILDDRALEEIWNHPDLQYLINGVPMFEKGKFDYAEHLVTEIDQTEMDMVYLHFSNVSIKAVEDYKKILIESYFPYISEHTHDTNLYIAYTQPEYGIGVQFEMSGSNVVIITFFEQGDNILGFDPVPKG